ncbi:MAG: hypothetical protein CYPHOPRED_005352 [Cyphobasidiales sp. Tagirdzhanova-0007]|nr:MAG: hypothetical protein CYPHOPRED_005352 [Cyphobasidiales sp. Tagirdzhanova-0007]
MHILLPASLLAFASYYSILSSTPTPSVSWLIALSSTPKLLAVYKAIKWILRVCLRKGSELERVLAGGARAALGRIRLEQDEEGTDEEDDDQVKLVRTAKKSKEVEANRDVDEQRRTLISSNLTVSADDLTDVGTSVCLTKGIDASSPSSSLLQDIICHLRDIQTASEKLVERSEEQYDKNDQEQEAMLRELWTLFKPDKSLDSLSTKQWQDVRTIPSPASTIRY